LVAGLNHICVAGERIGLVIIIGTSKVKEVAAIVALVTSKIIVAETKLKMDDESRLSLTYSFLLNNLIN
jgi:hypothetical protein